MPSTEPAAADIDARIVATPETVSKPLLARVWQWAKGLSSIHPPTFTPENEPSSPSAIRNSPESPSSAKTSPSLKPYSIPPLSAAASQPTIACSCVNARPTPRPSINTLPPRRSKPAKTWSWLDYISVEFSEVENAAQNDCNIMALAN